MKEKVSEEARQGRPRFPLTAAGVLTWFPAGSDPPRGGALEGMGAGLPPPPAKPVDLGRGQTPCRWPGAPIHLTGAPRLRGAQDRLELPFTDANSVGVVFLSWNICK